MDKLDRIILDLLQKNSDLTIQEISKSVYLSTTPCWQRIKRLKERGFIQKTVAILDPKMAELNTTVFVFVTIENHDKDKLELFSRVVSVMPEIVECHRLSGSIDYLLKVIITKGVVRKIEKNKNHLKVLQIIPTTLKRFKNKFQRFLRFFFSLCLLQ